MYIYMVSICVCMLVCVLGVLAMLAMLAVLAVCVLVEHMATRVRLFVFHTKPALLHYHAKLYDHVHPPRRYVEEEVPLAATGHGAVQAPLRVLFVYCSIGDSPYKMY